MKRRGKRNEVYLVSSPPTRGAWIETAMLSPFNAPSLRSPPTRGAWIETFMCYR